MKQFTIALRAEKKPLKTPPDEIVGELWCLKNFGTKSASKKQKEDKDEGHARRAEALQIGMRAGVTKRKYASACDDDNFFIDERDAEKNAEHERQRSGEDT
jgi:hypothetical protein